MQNLIETLSSKMIGLALGGGAVLGAAHVGVLRALDESGIKVGCISGTSIGAFVAALSAFGKSWQEIKELALELDWLDISGFSLSQYGLITNEKICKIMDKALGAVNIEDADIPLAIIATDLSRGEKVVLNKGSVSRAVMASTCIPGIFIPVEFDDYFLVDGGVMENVPVPSVKSMSADFVIGVDLNAQQSFNKPENILGVLVNTVNLAMMNASALQTQDTDLLITPDLSSFNLFDTDQIPELIEQGYKAAKKCLAKEVAIKNRSKFSDLFSGLLKR